MLDVSAKKYADLKVNTTSVSNERLFWVRMHDIQERLGIKNMSNLGKKEVHGILETKNHTKD